MYQSRSRPHSGRCLLVFVASHLAAYYLQFRLSHGGYWGAVTSIGLCIFLLGLLAIAGFRRWPPSQKIFCFCKYALYASFVLLGFYSGASLRYRADLLLARNSMGLPVEQVQLFYGVVTQDALPTANHKEIRFTMQVFAASDAKRLVSSANGRVYVRARLPNPLPALGQKLAIQAAIRRIGDNGEDSKNSLSAKRSPVLFSYAEPRSLNVLPVSSVSRQNLRNESDFLSAGQAVQLRVEAKSRFIRFLAQHIANVGYREEWQALSAVWLDIRLDKLWQWRSNIRQSLFRSIQQLFPQKGRNLFLALLFGLDEQLPETVLEDFRNAGAMHILALSGFHVGILASIVTFLLYRRLGMRRSLLANSLILALYLFLVGPLPSLTRAVLMFILFNICKFFLRPRNGLYILASSAWLQTQVFPTAALSLSFQLSYTALQGLILFAHRCNTLAMLLHTKIFHRQHKAQQYSQQNMQYNTISHAIYMLAVGLQSRLQKTATWICQIILQGSSLTTAVLLCSSPILIANFGQLQWVSLFSSLVETPIIILYMWLSLALWPMLFLLEYFNFQQLVFHIQKAYSNLYELSISPMAFFSQAPAWKFYNDEGLRFGCIILYILLYSMILSMLWRYEIIALMKIKRISPLSKVLSMRNLTFRRGTCEYKN